MSAWIHLFVLCNLIILTRTFEKEKETCQNVTAISYPLHHSIAVMKDGAGNAAEITLATLVEQTSQQPCIKWETFAYYGSSLIVKDGCQGKFNVCFTDGVPPPSIPVTETADCVNVRLLSNNRQSAVKTIARSDGRGDLIVSMKLLQSYSAVNCVPGVTFSYHGHRVEAKFGCKGDFRVCLDPLIVLEPDMPDFQQKKPMPLV